MSKPENNKICQWYCCDCGQSYGTIIFKDKQDNIKTESSMSTVKYYSSILYNNHIIINKSLSPLAEEDEDYFTIKNVNLKHSGLPINIPDTQQTNRREAEATHNGDGPHFNRNDTPSETSTTGSPESEENEETNQFLINSPKRFSCHRCQHMMCPYCPKIRYKDL